LFTEKVLDHELQRRVSSVALREPPKGVGVQQMAGANQAFLHQKTNSLMKTGPNEVAPRVQAALWVEVLKWVSLGWVGASSHSLGGLKVELSKQMTRLFAQKK
jgi:hypothetical protein